MIDAGRPPAAKALIRFRNPQRTAWPIHFPLSKFSPRRRAKSVAAALFLSALFLFYGSSWPGPGATGGPAAHAAGDLAAGSLLRDLADEPRRLEDWSGQTRLVNFWATWCRPCRQEMPLLEDAYERYRDHDFVVIGIALDEPDAVSTFKARVGISYPLLVADISAGTELMRRYGNRSGAVPFSLLLSRAGDVLETHLGALDESGLERLLRRHLAPPAPATRTTGIHRRVEEHGYQVVGEQFGRRGTWQSRRESSNAGA